MNILMTGGAGYIGSHTAKLLAACGHQPDRLRRPHAGPRVGGQVGAARTGHARRPGSPARGVRAPPHRRRRALRRQRAGRRVDDEPVQVLPQQHRGHAQPARRDARGRRRHHRLLLDVRDLWRSSARADRRDASAGAGQPVRRIEADGGEDAALVRRGVRAEVDRAPLLQRGRRRPRRRDRRGPRSRRRT